MDGRLNDKTFARLSDDEIRGGADRDPGDRAVDSARLSDRGSRSADVLLLGDLALRRAVRNAYGFDHLPNEDEMAELADRWRPYRSLAVSYLFASEFEKGT